MGNTVVVNRKTFLDSFWLVVFLWNELREPEAEEGFLIIE